MVNFQEAAEFVRTGDIASLERLPDSEAKELATKVDEGENKQCSLKCTKELLTTAKSSGACADERTLLHTAASVGNLHLVEFFRKHDQAAVNRADEEVLGQV